MARQERKTPVGRSGGGSDAPLGGAGGVMAARDCDRGAEAPELTAAGAAAAAANGQDGAPADVRPSLRQDCALVPGIGSFVRRRSVDELPQPLNVLKGDIPLRTLEARRDPAGNPTGELALPAKEMRTRKAAFSQFVSLVAGDLRALPLASKPIDSASRGAFPGSVSARPARLRASALLPYWGFESAGRAPACATPPVPTEVPWAS